MVPKDKSAAFRLDYPASEIVVAQPDTLSLVATTDRSFYVRGKALGVTNILIYDAQHRLAQVVDVRVGYDVDSLQADLDTALPGEHDPRRQLRRRHPADRRGLDPRRRGPRRGDRRALCAQGGRHRRSPSAPASRCRSTCG